MSRSCCNNNSCNSCNGNSALDFGNSWIAVLAIFLIFGGGGFSQSSFWGDYNKVFRCSGFANAWCDNNNSNFSSLIESSN